MLLDRVSIKSEAKDIVKNASVSAYLFTLLFLALSWLLAGMSDYVSLNEETVYNIYYATGVDLSFLVLHRAFPALLVTFITILAALLGQELLRCDLSTMCHQADEAGLCYDFQFVDDLPVRPSELAEMDLSGDRRTIRLTGVSLGGGEIEITRLNGSDILLRGKRRETICLGPEGARVVPEDAAAGPGQWLARLEPLFPFPQQEGAVPFRTAQEMFAYARDTGRPLWRVAFDYESALTGATEAELRAYARQVLDICRHARQQGVRPDNHFIGVTDARAARYKALREGRKLIDLGAADEACLDAMSIMEFSNAHGTIVCMPTGGASGIVPAAVYRTGEQMGKTETEQENALLVAGLIGAFYYPTHYTGAIGCQAEIGSACSMAAAALAELHGMELDQIEYAAEVAMEHHLGLTCDPVRGLVQIPCIERNAVAAKRAIDSANLAHMLVGTRTISFDMVVRTMYETGVSMNRAFRETSEGGLAKLYSRRAGQTLGK